MVDLAGSERLKESGATGDRLTETKHINKSLSNLGNVIMALAAKESHIPYRNSKLTLLLQQALGGSAKTLMFVNCSPSAYNEAETKNSLDYATRVKTIKNIATKNVESKEAQVYKKHIHSLEDMMDQMKQLLLSSNKASEWEVI